MSRRARSCSPGRSGAARIRWRRSRSPCCRTGSEATASWGVRCSVKRRLSNWAAMLEHMPETHASHDIPALEREAEAATKVHDCTVWIGYGGLFFLLPFAVLLF